MVDAWTNFAKYGDPNGKDKEIWKPYTEENQQFMIFKLGASGDAASRKQPDTITFVSGLKKEMPLYQMSEEKTNQI